MERQQTGQEQTEETLRESQRHYRMLAESAQDHIFIIDDDIRVQYSNPFAAEQFGFHPEEIIGKRLEELFPAELSEIFIRNVRTVFASDEPLYVEDKIAVFEKETIWLDTRLIPLKTERGKTKSVLGISRDITERKRAQEALKKAREELERRVEEGTAEVVKANERLKREIEERRQAEHELKIRTSSLKEANTALRVLLKTGDKDKTELEEKVFFNMKEVVEPYLEKLKKSGLKETQEAYASILESNLKDIISPFSRRLTSKYLNLTPSEIQVANLVKHGKSTIEIGDMLNLSDKTIESHRKNIRKKIGLRQKKVNLRTHLLTFQ